MTAVVTGAAIPVALTRAPKVFWLTNALKKRALVAGMMTVNRLRTGSHAWDATATSVQGPGFWLSEWKTRNATKEARLGGRTNGGSGASVISISATCSGAASPKPTADWSSRGIL